MYDEYPDITEDPYVSFDRESLIDEIVEYQLLHMSLLEAQKRIERNLRTELDSASDEQIYSQWLLGDH